MEKEGNRGPDLSGSGIGPRPERDIWPAKGSEFGWWLVPRPGGMWQPMTDFRFGMHYQQDFIGHPLTTTEALGVMNLGRR
jgi:hypothetical protein